MLQKVRIQILDNPLEEVMLNAEEFDEADKEQVCLRMNSARDEPLLPDSGFSRIRGPFRE